MDKLREIYPQRKFVMSRFEEVFEKIEAQRDNLATLKGEFIDGKYMRVHRTIGSTRMDIKIAHARIENKIVNLLEPLQHWPGRWVLNTTTACWRKCGKRS